MPPIESEYAALPVQPVAQPVPVQPVYQPVVQPVAQPVVQQVPVQPVVQVNPMPPMAQVMQPVEAVAPVVEYAAVPAVPVYERRRRIIYFVFGLIETLILIRVILKLLAANPQAGFTGLIYGITYPFVALFSGVFPTPQGSGSVFELSSVLAIGVYALLAYGIVRLLEVTDRRRPNAMV